MSFLACYCWICHVSFNHLLFFFFLWNGKLFSYIDLSFCLFVYCLAIKNSFTLVAFGCYMTINLFHSFYIDIRALECTNHSFEGSCISLHEIGCFSLILLPYPCPFICNCESLSFLPCEISLFPFHGMWGLNLNLFFSFLAFLVGLFGHIDQTIEDMVL